MATDGNGQDLTALAGARRLIDAGRYEDAATILHDQLKREPESPMALFLMARVLVDTDKAAIALPMMEKAAALDPSKWQHWMALGASLLSMQLFDRAADALMEAYRLAPASHVVMQLIGHLHLNRYELVQALQWADDSIAMADNPEAHIARGFALLHLRDWDKGWPEYVYGLGRDKTRTLKNYGIPEWNGQDGPLLVYGEQGPGDQIAYCSNLPTQTVAVNAMPKLRRLLANSLGVQVFGAQYDDGFMPPGPYQWQASMSQAMCWRTTELPRAPYLKPTAAKVLQWRSLYAALSDRPKIGIAWTGGSVGTAGWRTRSMALDEFMPMFDLGADIVSLEYRDDEQAVLDFEARTGKTIHRFPWGAQSKDFDDVAAMIAPLDAIVCVPTTAYHLAGAMGVKAHVLVHDKPHFWEGVSEERSPWWASVRWFRRPLLGTKAVEQAAEGLFK